MDEETKLHGPEITRFTKPGQVLKVMRDGCIIFVLTNVSQAQGDKHTIPEHRDSAATRKSFIESGYIEEEL